MVSSITLVITDSDNDDLFAALKMIHPDGHLNRADRRARF